MHTKEKDVMKFKAVNRILSLLLILSAMASAQEYDRERYDVIVERSPFGEDPLIEQIEKEKIKEAAEIAAAVKKLEKELRLCYLLKSDSGEIRAGFQNLTAKKGDPTSVMLNVGESFRGLKLLAIDLENSSATLDSNGKTVTFELKKAATPAKKAAPKAPAVPQRRFGGGFKKEPAKPVQPQLTPEEQEQRRKEVRENLQQYQMEVIRAGMPPLPIPLTPEMDNQLVEEGVLPPAEE